MKWWLDDIARDVRFARRQLMRQRSVTLVATMVLALGIGANGVFVTLVEMICIRGLPIERPDRVMYLASRDAQGRDHGVSYRDFEDLRGATPSFSGMAAFITSPMTIADEGLSPDRFSGAYVSASAFNLVGGTAALGRAIEPGDDRAGSAPVVLLGHRVCPITAGSLP